VIDTDRIARELVEPGSPVLGQIAEELGKDYLDHRGGLNRGKLRQAIFADSDLRMRLETILHPLIRAEVLDRIAKVSFPYCLVVVPLFAESGGWAWVDRVLVVDVAESVQVERVMKRDRIGPADAKSILAAQAGREERLRLADDVIDNSGEPASLARQVLALHRKYLDLARGRV
jgi:dephospho-CoA kinase